jgi:hypothetical protein
VCVIKYLLEILNIIFLIWLVFKLINEENMWKKFIQNKYLHPKTLSQVHMKSLCPPFFNGLAVKRRVPRNVSFGKHLRGL